MPGTSYADYRFNCLRIAYLADYRDARGLAQQASRPEGERLRPLDLGLESVGHLDLNRILAAEDVLLERIQAQDDRINRRGFAAACRARKDDEPRAAGHGLVNRINVTLWHPVLFQGTDGISIRLNSKDRLFTGDIE